MGRRDDHFSDCFYSEPLPSGPFKGAKLSKKEMDEFLDEIYHLYGWDKSGIPTTEKMLEIGLEEEAKQMKNLP